MRTIWRHPAAAALAILFGITGPSIAAGPAAGPHGPTPGPAQEILADPMVKLPYLLFPGTPEEMKVLWQLGSTANATLEWGTDLGYSAGSVQTTEYGSAHQHAHTITGLVPATKYYYRVTAGGVSHTGSFVSAPEPDATRLTFLAYGDTRSNPGTHDQVARAMLSAIEADPARPRVALVSGDLVSQGGTESAWTNEWFTTAQSNIRALTATVPFAVCVGNHELDGGSTLLPKYFPYRFAGSRYYSFDYGPAHFTVLDQYVGFDSTSAQGRWFKADLAGSSKPWKFVLLHEPGWSAAGGHSNNSTVQRHIQPFCERYGVAMVFAGHNHYYSRAVVRGVQHVTTGGGGAPLKSPESGQSNVVAMRSTSHFCRIEIDGDVLRFRAVDRNGAVIDSVTTDRVTPTLVALFTAEVQDEGVRLRWGFGAAVRDVAVERAPAEAGPWTALALTPLAEGGRFEAIDRDAAPGRPWWYRLTATLADGSSATFGPVRAEGPGRVTASGLMGAAPNPFSRSIHVEYVVESREPVRLSVVDVAGRELDLLVEGTLEPGRYTAVWDGRRERTPLPAGMYFLLWKSPGRVMHRRVVLVR
jgi:hypothetical protein